MEILIFLFGSAVAFLIALLAWGDLIRRPRQDLYNLERQYLDMLGMKKSEVLPVLRTATNYSFSRQMSSIIALYKKTKDDPQVVALRNDITGLRKQSDQLTGRYTCRYYLVILLTFGAFILGTLSYFSGHHTLFTFCKYSIHLNEIYVGTFLLVAAMILIEMADTSRKETVFFNSLNDAIDKI